MRVFLRLFLLFAVLGCGSKTAVPKDIIPVAKMTDVMWDMLLADGLTSYRYPLDSLKRFDTSVVLYQEIAKAHGTNQQQMRKSLQFYESRPDLFQIIIDSLQQRSTLPLEAYKKDTSAKKGGLFHKPLGRPKGMP
jgi:Domain of unknown function (DUF4296)